MSAQLTASSSEQLAATAHEMSAQADTLNQLISFFQFNRQEATASVQTHR